MAKKIYFLSTILFLINTISCQYLYKTEYNMNQILELKVVECTKNSDCPSYSNGCYIPALPENRKNGFCNVYYICHDDESNCYVLNKNDIEENEEYGLNVSNKVDYNYPFYNVTNKIKEQLILTTCDRNNIKNNKCMTEFCFKHSDCFSNHCYLGNCETFKEKKAHICSLVSPIDNYSINYETVYSIMCKYAKQEECEYNSDCFTNLCDNISGLCVNEKEVGKLHEKENKNILGLPPVLFFIIIFMLIIPFCVYCCCRIPLAKRNRGVRLND
ncbi:hypothetical protein BCR36DRAFT_321264 [Piromyces finnis]|uniref:Dickkopf N-terminal cysteine-rich domain-containing protein n=1 Tax=Piromyces finnis TaxID=1754191 RepID=A0A1Y1VFX7_9FUNG|nr:hypothetical protein BCR36DRAFT_321264 [Piromyces finnis]|eukprot:ORX55308.1 hypothetical protein BCR36DRAFT_321264 [Piromyces finnis]